MQHAIHSHTHTHVGEISELLARLQLQAEEKAATATPKPKVLDELTAEGVVKRIQEIEKSKDSQSYIYLYQHVVHVQARHMPF